MSCPTEDGLTRLLGLEFCRSEGQLPTLVRNTDTGIEAGEDSDVLLWDESTNSLEQRLLLSGRQMALLLKVVDGSSDYLYRHATADWIRGFAHGSDSDPRVDINLSDFNFLGLRGNVGMRASELTNSDSDRRYPVSPRQLRLLAFVCHHGQFGTRTRIVKRSIHDFAGGYAAASELLQADRK